VEQKIINILSTKSINIKENKNMQKNNKLLKPNNRNQNLKHITHLLIREYAMNKVVSRPILSLLTLLIFKIKKFIIRKKITTRFFDSNLITYKPTTALSIKNLKLKLLKRSTLLNYRRTFIKFILSQSFLQNIDTFMNIRREKISKIINKKKYLLVDKKLNKKKKFKILYQNYKLRMYKT